ncbi:MAG: SpiroCoCo family coiled-coil protein [Spirochaeta sp.]
MFTIGNAIVLGVVIIILVIYRQLDMNNRSLEKVRRYADKAQQELDKIVAQKATLLKDIAVEVDVHQKSAVEVLKRLNLSETDLQSKSEQFEGFSRRISEYDNALHELLEMTTRAEENIGRVRDESEYIDKVGKRIKNAAGQLEHLEKRIPKLAEDFAAENRIQLDAGKQALIEKTAEQLQDFTRDAEEIQRRIDAFAEYMTGIEERSEQLSEDIQNSIRDIYEQLTHDAESHASRLFAEFSDEIDTKLQQTQGAIETMDSHAESVVRTAADRVTELKNDAETAFESVIARLQDTETEYDQRLSRIAERGERMETAALEKLRDQIQQNSAAVHVQLQNAAEQADQDIAQHKTRFSEEIEALKQDFVSRQSAISQSVDEFVHGLEARYQRDSQGVDTRIVQLKEHLLESEQDVQLYREQLGRQLAEWQNSASVELQNTFDLLQSDLFQRDAAFKEELQQGEERGKSSVEAVLTRLTQDIDAQTESLRSGMEQRITQLQKTTEDQHERIDTMFSQLKTELEQWIDGTRGYIAELDTQETQLKARIEDLESHMSSTDEQVKAQIAHMLGQLQTERSDFEDRIAAMDSIIQGQLAGLRSRSEDGIAQVEAVVTPRLHAAEEKIDQSVTRLEHKLIEQMQLLTEASEEQNAGLQTRLQQQLEELTRQNEEQILQRAEQMNAKNAQVGDWIADLQQRITDAEKANTIALEEVQNSLAPRIHSLEQQLSSEVVRFEEDLSRRFAELSRDAESKTQSVRQDIGQRFTAMNDELSEQTSAAREQISTAVSRLENSLLTSVDARISETEDAVRVRIDQIHAVADDVDQLESQLRATMQQIAERIRTEIDGVGAQMLEQRKADLSDAEADMHTVRAEMRSLEEGLDALKDRAYENVNAKLKVFEDDFFADLRTRSDAMEEQLAEWQHSVGLSLQNYKAEQQDERARLEQGFTELLRENIGELQKRSTRQYEKIQEQLQEFESNLQQRYADTERGIQDVEKQIHNDLEQLHARSQAQFAEELRKHDDELSAQLRDYEKTIHSDMRQTMEQAQSNQSELKAIMDSTRSDVTLWQTEVLQKLTGAEKEVDSDLAGFKMKVSNTIAEVQDDFARQRDELITRTERERVELTQQMDRLFAQSAELENRLSTEIQTALDTFAVRNQQYQTDFQNSVKEREQDIDVRLREFRGLVQDTREQFASMEDKLFGKLEDRANLLSVNVGEIEKRQKAFIDQTKIFERADSLKIGLQESIEELKTDLQRVENQRKELREMEGHFQRLRKLGDEAIDKMGRFTQEKRRIDQLEQDFQELMRLSQAVDTQVQTLNDSHDSMQAMQLKLRDLEELQSSVDERYQRMQAKQEVITGTTKAIDANFLRLQEVETQIQGFDQEISTIPAKIDGILEMVGAVQKDRSSIEKAVSQLGNLNTVLQDIEARIEKMQQAREWLARTETRFEEINHAADEQLRMLGSLLKDKPIGSNGSKEAPSVQSRDTVIKLSRNGWQVDEIAKATKLSPGEVELILEIAHK